MNTFELLAEKEAEIQFNAMVKRHHARMDMLRRTYETQGYLQAVSQRNPGYSILLTPDMSGDAKYRVTSFRDNKPLGHCCYDFLDGRSPAFNALQEFAGDNWQLTTR